MKNLDLWEVTLRNLQVKSEEIGCICYGHDENSSAGVLYMCAHNLVVNSFDENGETKWSKDLSEVASPDNKPVNVTFLALPNALCVGLENGELITVNDGASCDLAGVCDNGLLVRILSKHIYLYEVIINIRPMLFI